MDQELNLIEMELREVQIVSDPAAHQVIVLGEVEGAREFPILIGFAEVTALDMALHDVHTTRPLTHDLVGNVADGLGGEFQRVVIDDLNEDVYHAKLVVQAASGVEELIDSRPSDAIVMAAKRRLPIFAAEHVVEQATRGQSET